MDAYIKKIYDMLYSPIISPYNLLENAKLENYSYVKYFTNEEGLVAEMQCVIPGEGEMVFYYQFDKKEYTRILWRKKILSLAEKKQWRLLKRNIIQTKQQ